MKSVKTDFEESNFLSNKVIRKKKFIGNVCEFCGRKINNHNHHNVSGKRICSYEEIIFFDDYD